MVLRSGQNDVVFTGYDDQQGSLFARQAVFDQHLRAGGPEFVARKHVLHGGLGFGEGLGNDHTLSGGEAVCLDHDGRATRAQVGERGGDLGKDAGGGGRNAVFEQKVFGENLGCFEAGAVGFGAVGADVDGGEGVHKPE